MLDLFLIKSFLKKGLAERFHGQNNNAKSVVNEHCTTTLLLDLIFMDVLLLFVISYLLH